MFEQHDVLTQLHAEDLKSSEFRLLCKEDCHLKLAIGFSCPAYYLFWPPPIVSMPPHQWRTQDSRSLGQVYPRTGYLPCSCHGERICMQTNTCHARTDSCSYSGMVPLADGSLGTCPGSSGPGSALDFMHAVFVGLICPRSSLAEEKRIKDFYIYSIEK